MGRPRKTQDAVERPYVDWKGEGKALTWQLLALLKKHSSIRRGLWPGLGEPSGKTKKTVLQRELASKLLKDDPRYSKHVKEDPAKYGDSIKQKMVLLRQQYYAKKDILGKTAAGVSSAADIKDGSPLQNIWGEIQQDCPYWFELRDLHGERPAMNVTERAVRNSASAPKLDGLRKSFCQVKSSQKAAAAIIDSDSEDSKLESEFSSESDEGFSTLESENDSEAEDQPESPVAKKSLRCSITSSELDEYCNGTSFIFEDLDIFVPDPEPIVPVDKTKFVKSQQKPSAPIRHQGGKHINGIFEVWKSAADSKQMKLQTRKRKRDDAKAAQQLEKMRREEDRADKIATAKIERKKRADAFTWVDKQIEIAQLTGDTKNLVGLKEQYEHLFAH